MKPSAALKAKSNAHYQCQECGATEFIQAHHQIPDDDNSIVVLCADCHSKKHPNLPSPLFFNKTHQPYWGNKSASSLARQLHVHPRTIIRAIRKLTIERGELTKSDESRIKNAIIKHTVNAETWNKFFSKHFHERLVCLQCGHQWLPLRSQHPWTCPSCGAYDWDGSQGEFRRAKRRVEDGGTRVGDIKLSRQHMRTTLRGNPGRTSRGGK